ncbi:MAG: fibronectin type III domain-containing protein [Verrucomicrobiae bacterium]|nr:fibronectin type III domain-containing protein [Verrucomicrobiae bacterium]
MFPALETRALGGLRLVWDASPDPNVVGYNVYVGGASRRYTNVISVGNVTEVELNNLPPAPALYFAVTALDALGGESAPSNEVMWAPWGLQSSATARPVFRVRGQGYISPDYSGRNLALWKTYTVAAVPMAGYVFAGWSGTVRSSEPRLNFVMQPGLFLEATFIPSPFAPLAGQYNGLFYETNGVRHDRAGFFTLTLTARGTYSGRLQLGGLRIPFSGMLPINGLAEQTLARSDGSPLNLKLQFGDKGNNDRVLGTVGDGREWVAMLSGDRVVFDSVTRPCPLTGNYTMALLGKSNDRNLPAGHGAGTLRVSPAGRLTFSGMLADDTRMSQTAWLSPDGAWPLYASLYGGRGCALGWIIFESRTSDDLRGSIVWIKPSDAAARFYPAGFAAAFDAIGSVFVPPLTAADSALGFTNGQVVFDGPCLASPAINPIALGPNDKVLPLGPNRLSMSISRGSGTFMGRVADPASGLSRIFRGVVLQKAARGLGYLQCDRETARVELNR